MSILTTKKVHDIFMDCLFKDEEVAGRSTEEMLESGEVIPASGILNNIGFNASRLNTKREEVKTMLSEFSDDFHVKGGGGMSFLNACNDKDGNQWTGEHKSMEEIFLLGIGLDMVQLAPRAMWPSLPGCMPYVTINLDGFKK